jgi:hypothetical protein
MSSAKGYVRKTSLLLILAGTFLLLLLDSRDSVGSAGGAGFTCSTILFECFIES